MKTVLVLTIINLVGFIMIGPFTPFTIFIGVPGGFIAIFYSGWKILTLASTKAKLYAGLLLAANIYILYVSIDFLA